ncbi:MAG: hypothetical protein LAP39_06350 [Acidobacteriia bacterium]|nr:hypothetical protein [Terriglobia bacterium]
MHHNTRYLRYGLPVLLAISQLALGEEPAKHYSRAEIEDFLLHANVVDRKELGVGVTNSARATLSDGKLEHLAHIQSIDETKAEYKTARGTELNFKDTYKYNIAAYRLDKILDLNMIPASVERKIAGKSCAVTWWVDDKMFDEIDRVKQGLAPPDLDAWNKQMYVVRVFDQLIDNTDRNLGNLVIDKQWRMWMIDHTRAFRTTTKIRSEANLVMCDRKLLAGMRKLDEDTLNEQLRPYLNKTEIKAMLARRDKIVKFFEEAVTNKGQGAVLYDMPPRE